MASAIQGLPGLAPPEVRARTAQASADPAFDRLLAARRGASAGSLVPIVPTRIDGSDAAQALGAAWQDLFGEAPAQQTLAVLTAQWAHETGGGKSMYNYNFGGIKGAGPGGMSVAARTREGSGATERIITDRFRAYSTAEAGAADYVKLLRDRFPEALHAAKRGDPDAFVRALKQRGYFTGDEAAYVQSVASLTAQGLSHGFASLGSPLADGRPPRVLDSTSLPASGVDMSTLSSGLAAAGPFIDALRLGDEISRAALRIGAPRDRRDG